MSSQPNGLLTLYEAGLTPSEANRSGVWHSFKNIGDKTINVIGYFPKSRESEVDFK